MAKRPNTLYLCTSCGQKTPSWSGRCPNCQAWNTLEESISEESLSSTLKAGHRLVPKSISKAASTDNKRLLTNMKDIDNVLGGGIVPASIILLAGQPGIGKSTLLLQLAFAASKNCSVVYISAEESAHQVGIRAKRLGALSSELKLATSNSANDIAATIASNNYDLVIIDSIQAIALDEIGSSAGSVSQITNSCQIITKAAKSSNTAIIIVGHVTKEGTIAGPKVLEHSVDVVLQLEGDRYGGFKLLRAEKNRFGSTSETGIFEMEENGLQQIENPSEALLKERQITDGSVVLATMEGTRPLLVEVQALVNKTSYGYPKRAASGFDLSRLNLLIAMLERRTKLNLADKDIYINVVGGIAIKEAAADLAVCMAIGSAAKGYALKDNFVVFGEVGLAGEIRHVPFTERRLDEAKKLGFDGAIGPKQKINKSSKAINEAINIKSTLNLYLKKD